MASVDEGGYFFLSVISLRTSIPFADAISVSLGGITCLFSTRAFCRRKSTRAVEMCSLFRSGARMSSVIIRGGPLVGSLRNGLVCCF